MTNVISMSNARKDLPKMVREIQKNPETVFKIAVRSETVAELRAAKPMAPPRGSRSKVDSAQTGFVFASQRQRKVPISKNVKKFLYARERNDPVFGKTSFL